MSKVALDTNILIYAYDKQDLHKREIARELLISSAVVSAQTVSEYINVLKRLTAQPKDMIIDLCIESLANCTIQPINKSTLLLAKHIIHRYDLQIFDSIIVASALEADCKILYSEDMRNDMEIEAQLTIINPFL
ncbi:ribonuclease VapC [Bacteroidia bacterium]|nr:ribonuclease VapC [Bacteroidia bacterium]